MMDLSTKQPIKIKLLDFDIVPFEFEIDLSKDNIILSLPNSIGDIMKNQRIELGKQYKKDSLCALTANNEKCTLLDCCYCIDNKGFQKQIHIAYRVILLGEHKKNLREIKFDKLETIVDYRINIEDDFNYNNLGIVIKPLWLSDNLPDETKEYAEYDDIYTGKLNISINGKQTLIEAEAILWRLSEYLLLTQEDMFSYDTFKVSSRDKQYEVISHIHGNNIALRRGKLKTKYGSWNGSITLELSSGNIKEEFPKFVKFRDESGIIFDVFRCTVYSQSFREDYPLRLSQITEGLANFLGIANTNNRQDNFNSALQLSLYCNDYIKQVLPKQSDIQKFAEDVKNHRNKFTHVKGSGKYLEKEDNDIKAEILYTTLRVIMIKYIRGEL